jgi:DNA-binding beta-propeller fold protein YncE
MRSSLAILLLAACGGNSAPPTAPIGPTTPVATTSAQPHSISLPGAPEGGVFLDYLAYDAGHHNVWVPAGGTGRVDVIDATTGKLTPIEGFPTKEMERNGQKRTVGPTSATVGDGVVYVGNRGDSTICAIDAATLAKKDCVTLDGMPDGLQYIASTKEVWVTTPRDKAIRILDVSKPDHPTLKTDKLTFDGEPEGFAVDNKRGLFFTNLEDKDKTLVIDLKTHATTKTWEPKCGEDGPKGLIFDDATNHLIVVCPASIETLDVAHDGAMIGNLAVGDGLDAIDYTPGNHLVFAAAARAEKMIIATLGADGKLVAVATVPTAKGARNAVATEDGTAYVADGPAGTILVVPPQAVLR